MKWITVEGRGDEGKAKPLLIHGAYELQVGDRVTVFPSRDPKIPYAVSKGLPISVGRRVVVVPHEQYPQSRIARSAFANDEVGPQATILPEEMQLLYVGQTAEFEDGSQSNPPATSWLWNFGDPRSGDLNESTDPSGRHQYDHPGWYDVRLRVGNDLTFDEDRHEGAVRVEVPYPTECVATNLGGGRVRISWTPGDPNDACRLVRRADFYPPHPNNGTRVYEGAATSIEEVLPVGMRYYYRVWGIFEGVFSEGYRDDSILVRDDADAMPLPWGEFSVSISSGDGVYGGGLISSSEYPSGLSSGVSKELYFEKNGGGDASYARATGTITGPWTRLTGWIGIILSDITSAGGNRVQVNGTTVWQKTEAQYGGSLGSIQWVQVNIPLNGGSPTSNFSLRLERYHNKSYHTRFSGFFYDMKLEN